MKAAKQARKNDMLDQALDITEKMGQASEKLKELKKKEIEKA